MKHGTSVQPLAFEPIYGFTVEARLRRIVARVAGGRDPERLPVDADVYADLGVKSTAALDLVLSLEEEFGVAMDDGAFNDARTISSLVDLVQSILRA